MKDEIKEISENIKSYYVGDNIDKLLDYITNLQDKYERYRTANSTLSEAENFMYNQAKDYKTRIDKAIEKATHIQKIYGYELSDLIFLLQGSDK